MGGKIDPKTRAARRSSAREVAIEQRVQDSIHDDADFYVTTQGVLGEQFLAIDPGTPEQPVARTRAPTVKGIDPPRLDLFLAKAYELLDIDRQRHQEQPRDASATSPTTRRACSRASTCSSPATATGSTASSPTSRRSRSRPSSSPTTRASTTSTTRSCSTRSTTSTSSRREIQRRLGPDAQGRARGAREPEPRLGDGRRPAGAGEDPQDADRRRAARRARERHRRPTRRPSSRTSRRARAPSARS